MVIKSKDFEGEVLKSETPVLVDFFAEWCMPCKMIAPTLEQLAAEYAGKIKIVKLDIDQSTDITGKYNVRSVPTLMFFKNGEIVDQVVGAIPKQNLADKIGKVII